MIDKGQMLSRHDFSKVNWGILAAAALLLTTGAVLLLLPLLNNSMDEAGVLALLQAGTATILLGCILLVLRHYLRPTLTYRLYEYGVRVVDNASNKERFIPFEKISEIYRYRARNPFGQLCNVMAFRCAAERPWYTIFSNLSHAWSLSDAIINQQVQIRGPQALNELYNGNVLDFTYINNNARALFHLLRNDMRTLPGQTLHLSSTLLITPQRQIPLATLGALESNREQGTIRLLDKQGNTLFVADYFALICADLFIALLEHMIYHRATDAKRLSQ
ncbi:hypothetical protein BIY27_08565 [Gibbsiella quercinecans]|uniref:hypothetical protein n=1 Tax=Gibbsiella quercinecans TaxID=929813 RepID=UPI000EF2632F|nr:hypothetical protein [Gibbsiella quercinecans]RLM14271.1 hypothetical protein BIY27_08565 [Gibbsiella quercinecans]